MKTSLETLEDNKVKLLVEVEEAEFEPELESAFKRISQEISLPGFRKGKAPRSVIEARIGSQHARDEAFRTSLPDFYSKAVDELEVDVIAPPEIDITEGQEEGPIHFEAIVEVRPVIEVSGYKDVEVEVEPLAVTDDDVQEAIDSIRKRTSELNEVERAAADGDSVNIDIETTHKDEEIEGFTTSGYAYEVGSGQTLEEMDKNLVGVSAGDEVSFDAKHPDEEETEPLKIKVKVNTVSEVVLPEVTPEWVKDNSEFETAEELTAEYRSRLEKAKVNQAGIHARNELSERIAELVGEDVVPQSMIDTQADNRLQEMAMRLQQQGIDFQQFLEISGQDSGAMMDEVKETAKVTAKLDLALRSIAEKEGLSVSDAEVDEEFAKIGAQMGKTADEIRSEFGESSHIKGLSADILKSKTMDWLVDNISIKDSNGKAITAADLEIIEEES